MADGRYSESKEINGVTYTVYKLQLEDSWKCLTDLLDMFGPGFGGLFAGDKSDVSSLLDGGVDEEGASDKSNRVSQALAGIADRYGHEKFWPIIKKLATVTEVQKDGAAPKLSTIFEIHFAGDLKAMMTWAIFALGVQYKDFLSGKVLDIAQ